MCACVCVCMRRGMSVCGCVSTRVSVCVCVSVCEQMCGVSPYATATAAGCCYCSRKELLCRNMEGSRPDEQTGIEREVVVGGRKKR